MADVLTGITADEYMARYAEDFYEWVNGKVVKIPPITLQHNDITIYLRVLLDTFFAFKPLGQVISAPFVMSLPSVNSKREPDLQIVLNGNLHRLTNTYMDGPADICVEVVAPESVARDHGEKFVEYERGKVREYWIVDPIHHECRIYRINGQGIYARQYEDKQGNYQTPLLLQFVLHIPTLWLESLPDPVAIIDTVRNMVGEASQE
ncbi:MAG: Uma2 family endonuclease [Anaerolineae bacterium]|nr:Uma2 family endonuclease [Anaerolineae bacterium]